MARVGLMRQKKSRILYWSLLLLKIGGSYALQRVGNSCNFMHCSTRETRKRDKDKRWTREGKKGGSEGGKTTEKKEVMCRNTA